MALEGRRRINEPFDNPVIPYYQRRDDPQYVQPGDIDENNSHIVTLYGPDGQPLIGSSGILPTHDRRLPVFTPFTGVIIAIGALNPGINFQLMGIRFHSSGLFAAAETLTITAIIAAGAVHNVVIYTRDLSVGAVLDLVIPFGGDEDFYQTNDRIQMALSANANARTYGIMTIHELT